MNLWVIVWKYKTVKTNNAYWHMTSGGMFYEFADAQEYFDYCKRRNAEIYNYKLCQLTEVKTDGKEKS